jgi:hypothetical protein
MYPVKDPFTELYGYWKSNGWFIQPAFSYAHDYLNGYAVVDVSNDQCRLLSTNGTLHNIADITGYPLAKDPNLVGFANSDSEPAAFAVVCCEDDGRRVWGLLDTKLRYTRLPDEGFSDVAFTDTWGPCIIAVVDTRDRFEKLYGLFDTRDMRWEIPIQYSCIYSGTDSLWVVARPSSSPSDKCFAFYDLETHKIVSDWHWGAQPFWEGFGTICEHDEAGWTFVDRQLRPVFDKRFIEVNHFSRGLAPIGTDNEAGYIDTSGNVRILPGYEELQPYNRFGWAIANRNGIDWDLDIIDREGRAHLTGFETAVFWDCDYPYFEVTKRGRQLYLDMDLKTVYEGIDMNPS